MINFIKNCISSRTMLFALLLAVFGVLEANMQLLSAFIPQHLYGVAVTLVGVIVAVLRVVTTTPFVGDK